MDFYVSISLTYRIKMRRTKKKISLNNLYLKRSFAVDSNAKREKGEKKNVFKHIEHTHTHQQNAEEEEEKKNRETKFII